MLRFRFKRKTLARAALFLFALSPGYLRDEDARWYALAKAMYAYGSRLSYEALLDFGTEVMLRGEERGLVAETIEALPRGARYDERTLKAAREILLGRRTRPREDIGDEVDE